MCGVVAVMGAVIMCVLPKYSAIYIFISLSNIGETKDIDFTNLVTPRVMSAGRGNLASLRQSITSFSKQAAKHVLDAGIFLGMLLLYDVTITLSSYHHHTIITPSSSPSSHTHHTPSHRYGSHAHPTQTRGSKYY